MRQLLIQPFVNYNLPQGWLLVSAPVSATLQAYCNVERPEFSPDWSLRIVVSFLFPK